ncbi:MAG TPA: hypothetical protein VFX44_04495 [Solirubrobacterales bacterium]|nr:hypothetical protein [Solirubrobacterales bacterium]
MTEAKNSLVRIARRELTTQREEQEAVAEESATEHRRRIDATEDLIADFLRVMGQVGFPEAKRHPAIGSRLHRPRGWDVAYLPACKKIVGGSAIVFLSTRGKSWATSFHRRHKPPGKDWWSVAPISVSELAKLSVEPLTRLQRHDQRFHETGKAAAVDGSLLYTMSQILAANGLSWPA